MKQIVITTDASGLLCVLLDGHNISSQVRAVGFNSVPGEQPEVTLVLTADYYVLAASADDMTLVEEKKIDA